MQRFVKEVDRPYDPDILLREQVIRYFSDVLDFLSQKPKTFQLFEQYFYSPYGNKLNRDEGFSRKPGSEAGNALKELTYIGKEQKIIKDLPFIEGGRHCCQAGNLKNPRSGWSADHPMIRPAPHPENAPY